MSPFRNSSISVLAVVFLLLQDVASRQYTSHMLGTAFPDRVSIRSSEGRCGSRMEELFNETLRGNLAKWRARPARTANDLRAFSRFRWNLRRGHPLMILDNQLFTPSFPTNVSSAFCEEGAYCDGRLRWLVHLLKDAIDLGGSLPNVFLWVDLRDAVDCKGTDDCQVPLFGFFVGRADWGQPFSWDTLEPGGGTLLVPAADDVDHALYDYPWKLKKNVAFFRGGRYCHGNAFSEMEINGAKIGCSRTFLTSLSRLFNGSTFLDASYATDHARTPGMSQFASEPPSYYSLPDHARFKFLLNLEGATLSERFAKLLHTNSVVMKEDSPWIEYFYPMLKPFEHYLPIFNRSAVDALELQMEYAERQDELAAIAATSQAFAATHLCKQARLLYWREA